MFPSADWREKKNELISKKKKKQDDEVKKKKKKGKLSQNVIRTKRDVRSHTENRKHIYTSPIEPFSES